MRGAQEIAALDYAHDPVRHIPVGRTIFDQGTPADYIYIVQSGWVSLDQTSPDGKAVILGFALPGDVLSFGRHTKVYTASGVALDNVAVCPIHISSQERLERSHPAYDALHRRVLGRALDAAEANLADLLCGRTAHERIAHLLWSLAFRSLHRPPLESDSVPVPISQIQIGLATGMTPVHVSRTLRSLREERLLDFDHHMIKIRNRAQIEWLARAPLPRIESFP